MQKYKNQASLLCFRENTFHSGLGEAILELLPSNKIIDCTVYASDVPQFRELKLGDHMKVRIKLTCYDYKKIKIRNKKMEFKGLTSKKMDYARVNTYHLYGKVIDITQWGEILDCGFFVSIGDSTTFYHKQGFKKGDWVLAEGNLEVSL